MSDSIVKKEHNLNIYNRQLLQLTGVTDVSSFSDEDVMVKTEYGELVVKGEGLHIEVLSLDTGDLSVKGKITAIIYNESPLNKGFFRRLIS